MARFSSVVLIFMLMVSASFMPGMEGRKLLINTGESNKNNVPSLFASLGLTALPKGTTVPASSPSKKGHTTPLDNEKLFARHLAAIDRILQSVPSPGAGH